MGSKGLEEYIRPYRNGRDLSGHSRGALVIDLFALSEAAVRARFPEVYQHLTERVRYDKDAGGAPKLDHRGHKTGREWNNRESYRTLWWIFGEPRRELRPALVGLKKFIATVDTSPHRVFQFLDVGIICDDKVVIIASEDAAVLGFITSRVHVSWSLAQKTRLGQGNDPVYPKTLCFDPFPFPDPVEDSLKARIRAAAEELDATRKRVLAEHPDLTLTGLYNVLERLRAIDARPGDPDVPPLTERERDVVDRGLVLILRELHATIDRLVFDAYGWPHDLPDQAILERLVALNRERVAEEKAGLVRWLRPDYQIARFGTGVEKARQIESVLSGAAEGQDQAVRKEPFPSDEVERTAAVFAAVAGAPGAIDPAAIAAAFRQGRRIEPHVRATLQALVRMGRISSPDGGRTFVFQRAA